LREEKTHAEQEVKSRQESLSSGRGFSSAQKSALRDEAIEEAMSRAKMTHREAASFIDSQKPENQAARNEIFAAVRSRKGERPTQFMKQPSLIKSGGSSFKNEFAERTREARNDAQKFDGETEAVRVALETSKIRHNQKTDSQISNADQIKDSARNIFPKRDPKQSAQNIKNSSDKIEKKIDERSSDGAVVAVAKKAWNTFAGNNKTMSNDKEKK
jgi:hypothetical protein